MKLSVDTKFRILAPAIVIAVVIGSFGLMRSSASDVIPPSLKLASSDLVGKKGHPKMESVLWELEAKAQQGGLPLATDLAQKRGIKLGADRVRVVVEAGDSVGEAIKGAEGLGAKLETTYMGYAQMEVPVGALSAIADLPQVAYVRQPYIPRKDALVSEGVAVVGADGWQKAGITGKGVKIGIVDLGFDGYDRLIGTELNNVTARSFRTSGDITGGGESHGAAVAEIVQDAAPDAQLFLANFETDLEFGNAVNWLINNKVDIISCSIGWTNAGPYNGTGPVDDAVNNARDTYGILWFNSAGNEGERHWAGSWADNTGDGYLNFTPDSKFNTIYVSGGTYVTLVLSWDDPWGASCNDLDLYLYDSGYREVATSLNWQRCRENPVETISYFATTTGYYHIGVKKYQLSGTVRINLFSFDYDLLYKVPAGSISIPADARGAVAVGATRLKDDVLESFSSQGPTMDGRTKPDLTAPDGVSTITYGPNNFYGTSASAPLAAGTGALVKSANPTFDAAHVQAYMEGLAKQVGTYGKNNQYGAGRISLPIASTPTPTVTGTPPTATPTATPTVTGTPATATPMATSTPTPVGTPAYRVLLPFVNRGS